MACWKNVLAYVLFELDHSLYFKKQLILICKMTSMNKFSDSKDKMQPETIKLAEKTH